MKLDEVAALYSLGNAKGTDLVSAALEAMTDGRDSENLHFLAGMSRPPLSEAGPAFEEALKDLGFPIPTKAEAVRFLAKLYAARIVAGELPPRDGARDISHLRFLADDPSTEVTYRFAGLLDDAGEAETALDYATDRLRAEKEYELDRVSRLILLEAKKICGS